MIHNHIPAENGKRCDGCGLNHSYWERFPVCGVDVTLKASESNSEEWYALECSHRGVDDWFATGGTYDSLRSAEQRKFELRGIDAFDWRIVKKILTTEVVE